MTYVMDMKEVLCMFATTGIKCHSLSYDIFNANMTTQDNTTCHKHDIAD